MLSHNEEDADEWIANLEEIQTRMNQVTIQGKSDKSDADVVLHILVYVPKAYEQQVVSLEATLDSDPTSVTIESVHDELNVLGTPSRGKIRIQEQREGAAYSDRSSDGGYAPISQSANVNPIAIITLLANPRFEHPHLSSHDMEHTKPSVAASGRHLPRFIPSASSGGNSGTS